MLTFKEFLEAKENNCNEEFFLSRTTGGDLPTQAKSLLVSLTNTPKNDIDQDRWKDFAQKYNNLNNQARNIPFSPQNKVLKDTLTQIANLLKQIKPVQKSGQDITNYTGDVAREVPDISQHIKKYGATPGMA